MTENPCAARPAGGSALFPPPTELQQSEDRLTRALVAAIGRVARGPVGPDNDCARSSDGLAAFDFVEPRRLDELVAWTIARLE